MFGNHLGVVEEEVRECVRVRKYEYGMCWSVINDGKKE